jgi:hypothetical protein
MMAGYARRFAAMDSWRLMVEWVHEMMMMLGLDYLMRGSLMNLLSVFVCRAGPIDDGLDPKRIVNPTNPCGRMNGPWGSDGLGVVIGGIII